MEFIRLRIQELDRSGNYESQRSAAMLRDLLNRGIEGFSGEHEGEDIDLGFEVEEVLMNTSHVGEVASDSSEDGDVLSMNCRKPSSFKNRQKEKHVADLRKMEKYFYGTNSQEIAASGEQSITDNSSPQIDGESEAIDIGPCRKPSSYVRRAIDSFRFQGDSKAYDIISKSNEGDDSPKPSENSLLRHGQPPINRLRIRKRKAEVLHENDFPTNIDEIVFESSNFSPEGKIDENPESNTPGFVNADYSFSDARIGNNFVSNANFDVSPAQENIRDEHETKVTASYEESLANFGLENPEALTSPFRYETDINLNISAQLGVLSTSDFFPEHVPLISAEDFKDENSKQDLNLFPVIGDSNIDAEDSELRPDTVSSESECLEETPIVDAFAGNSSANLECKSEHYSSVNSGVDAAETVSHEMSEDTKESSDNDAFSPDDGKQRSNQFPICDEIERISAIGDADSLNQTMASQCEKESQENVEDIKEPTLNGIVGSIPPLNRNFSEESNRNSPSHFSSPGNKSCLPSKMQPSVVQSICDFMTPYIPRTEHTKDTVLDQSSDLCITQFELETHSDECEVEQSSPSEVGDCTPKSGEVTCASPLSSYKDAHLRNVAVEEKEIDELVAQLLNEGDVKNQDSTHETSLSPKLHANDSASESHEMVEEINHITSGAHIAMALKSFLIILTAIIWMYFVFLSTSKMN